MGTNAMDKNVLKKYAIWARRELIVRVSQRATFYGVTEEDYGDVSADSINGRILSDTEKKQRKALIAQIRKKGYEEVIEEVAYTWFNRFLALRFMEVNGYLPDRVKIFTDSDNRFQPQILNEAIDLEIDGLDMEKVYAYKDANQTEELYKYLLVVQCNALNAVLPGMFQKIEDYTELLLPDKLLFEGSEESGGVEGLHILDGQILRIPDREGLKIPHIGWNSLHLQNGGRLFAGVGEGAFVYFVHSYYLKAADEGIVKASTEYGTEIHASVEQGNVFACQFHPEKSSGVGLQILKNFAG